MAGLRGLAGLSRWKRDTGFGGAEIRSSIPSTYVGGDAK